MDIAAGIDSIYIYRDSARTQGQLQPRRNTSCKRESGTEQQPEGMIRSRLSIRDPLSK